MRMMKRKTGIFLMSFLAFALLFFAAERTAFATETITEMSGTCGDNLTWEIADGVLTISGTGEMYDYYSANSSGMVKSPWNDYNKEFDDVIISEGVTYIGDYAFYEDSIVNVTFPNSLEEIGGNAFKQAELTEVNIPGDVKLNSRVFKECPNLKSVNITGKMEISSSSQKTFYKCTQLEKLVLGEGTTKLAQEMFDGCSSLKEINLPESLEIIRKCAFARCSALESVVIPASVTTLNNYAFSKCTSLKYVYFESNTVPETIDIYAFSDSSFVLVYPELSEEWAAAVEANTQYGGTIEYKLLGTEKDEETELKVIAIDDKQKAYIDEHKAFLEDASNAGYNWLMGTSTIENDFIGDFGSLKQNYETWSTVRFNLFDNPYKQVIATMILSEESATAQAESFEKNLGATQRSLINDISDLINLKNPGTITESNSDVLEKILTGGDVSEDDNTYKICKEVFGEAISDKTLKNIFVAYGAVDETLSLLDTAEDVVNIVGETMNKVAVVSAYEKTNDEFKAVLSDMYSRAKNAGNDDLAKALEDYVAITDDFDAVQKVVDTILLGRAEAAFEILEFSLKERTVNYLKNSIISASASNSVASTAVSGALSFLSGVKIGYDLTITLDKILIGSDDITDAYLYAYASADVMQILRSAMNDYADDFLEATSGDYDQNLYKKAMMFCQSFKMYQKIALETCKGVVSYFDQQMFALSITGDTGCEAAICQWNLRQLPWLDVSCHDESIQISGGTTTVINGKELNINVCSVAGVNLVTIENGQVTSVSSGVAATVSDDGKIYISLPSGEEYDIQVTSSVEQSVTCGIYAYDDQMQLGEIAGNVNLTITEDTTVDTTISSGTDGSLTADGTMSNGYQMDADEFISISEIQLNKSGSSLIPGKTLQLTATVLPETATVKEYSWSTSNSSVATVNENGLVTAKKEGTAVISCTSWSGNTVATCKITVAKLTQKISGASSFKKTLGSKAFSLKAAAEGKLTYTSSNQKVATVSSTGKITIKGVGKTTITIKAAATSNYKATSKKVTIKVIPKGTSLTSVKNSSTKAMNVKWKKNTKVTGYQIQYSRYKSFKNPKYVTIKGYKNTSKIIKKLTKNKYYYVRIRTYKTVNGTKYYSNWSSSKKVKISR